MNRARSKAFITAYDRAAARRDEARLRSGMILELIIDDTPGGQAVMLDVCIHLARVSRRFAIEASGYSSALDAKDPSPTVEYDEDGEEIALEHRRAEREAWEYDRIVDPDVHYAGSFELAYERAVERGGL